MVSLPAGAFVIGSPETEPGRYRSEGPQQRLRIAAFAMAETEVTRDQFAAFVRATGYRPSSGCDVPGPGDNAFTSVRAPEASWRDPGYDQTGAHPVVCVSFEDATAYAEWLSGHTGRRYRLPSEAEWEYAARGGTTTAFPWGATADDGCRHMNGGDRSLERGYADWRAAMARSKRDGDPRARFLGCDDGAVFTAPAGRYAANGFGLKDMAGSVWEWVADCYRPGGYEAGKVDGRPHEAPACSQRRSRGGSWGDYPDDLRSARRTSPIAPASRRSDSGFRVAADLTP